MRGTQHAGLTVLSRGPVRVEVLGEPFAISVQRGGRDLITNAVPWAADGTVHDRFISVTEGLIARETLQRPERATSATAQSADGWTDTLDPATRHAENTRATFDLLLNDSRSARLAITIEETDRVTLTFDAYHRPLRLGIDWDGAKDERFAGLGARHGHAFDQAGRRLRLGGDRRYTGPGTPEDLLEVGGIPQGDYAPAPWFLSSAGYAAWLETYGDGVDVDLGVRPGISARADSGPLTLHLLTDPTPAARLRHYCRLTGFPALLPEWGYGHWKSRDVYEHQTDVLEDLHGYHWHAIPLDAIVIDSPWETQYNTWEFNRWQFPDPEGMIARLRAAGVRTVVWTTPWVNLESVDGQRPPGPESERMHREPAPNYAEGARDGHFVTNDSGDAYIGRWWMGTGSPVDFSSPAAEEWWRAQARRALDLGIQGIKADDGEGFYFPPDVRFADGETGATAAWRHGNLYRRSMQRALDESHPGEGVLFGRSGWSGQQATGMLWAGDQISDFWSLRATVAASLSAAASGISNWSHDVGGYLGERLVDRCPPELLVRWAQFGCFTPLMQAHGRFAQEAWRYDRTTLELFRAYALLHERLVPYVRAAAATAARTGLPIMRPLCLVDAPDPRGWSIPDAYGYGPSLWVAPVLEEGATSRAVELPAGEWIETATAERVRGPSTVLTAAPLERIPVWVRSGSILVTYPAAHVREGLGDTPESDRPLEATLWGEPRCGRSHVRLADGTRIGWRDGAWEFPAGRTVRCLVIREAGGQAPPPTAGPDAPRRYNLCA